VSGHGAFEIEQVCVHTIGDTPPFGGRSNNKGSAIGLSDGSRDQAAFGQPIQDARQRRPLVRQALVQIGDRRRPRRRE